MENTMLTISSTLKLQEVVQNSRMGQPNKYTGEVPKPVNDGTWEAAKMVIGSLEGSLGSVWFTVDGEICISFETTDGSPASVTVYAEDEYGLQSTSNFYEQDYFNSNGQGSR